MFYLPSDHAPINRAEIDSRHSLRDDMRKPERLVITPLDVDWTLVPDKRDVRRWRAYDLAGELKMHASWPEMLRQLSAHQPRMLGRRYW